MTSTTASSASSSACRPGTARESRECHDPGRREAPCDERSAADFERALRQRSQLGERGGSAPSFGDEDTGQPPADAGQPPPPPLHPFALVLAQVQPPAAIDAAPPARGLVEAPSATLRAQLAQSSAPAPAAADAARAFEVSLKQPLGAALTLQAVAPAAGAPWALSIGAHGLNPQELRRNLGRLEERLRARGVSHEALTLHPPDTASNDTEDQP